MAMIRKTLLAAVLTAGCTLAFPAVAQETGLDQIHDQARQGGRTCMTSHFHYGSSSGQASKKLAETAAINDWRGFTAFEYGLPWGSWQLAAGKSLNCNNSGSSWGCNAEARPCKRSR